MGYGPIEVADQAQGVAEVVAGKAVIGFQPQRFAELRDGLLVPALGKQHQAEAVGGFRRARLETQGRAAAVGGAIELAERPQGLGQVGVVSGVARVAGNGLADLVGGAAVIPFLEGNDAEQVQRIRIAGLLSQHRLIKPSGLVESSLLDDAVSPGSVCRASRLLRTWNDSQFSKSVFLTFRLSWAYVAQNQSSPLPACSVLALLVL